MNNNLKPSSGSSKEHLPSPIPTDLFFRTQNHHNGDSASIGSVDSMYNNPSKDYDDEDIDIIPFAEYFNFDDHSYKVVRKLSSQGDNLKKESYIVEEENELFVSHTHSIVQENFLKDFGKKLGQNNIFPKFIIHSKSHDIDIVEYCGEEFEIVRKKFGKLTDKTTINLIIQLFDIFSVLQSERILHRNIQPSKFVMKEDVQKLVLMDFTKAVKLKDEEKHFVECGGQEYNVHFSGLIKGKHYGFKNEWISVIYCIVYFLNKNSLPWLKEELPKDDESMEFVFSAKDELLMRKKMVKNVREIQNKTDMKSVVKIHLTDLENFFDYIFGLKDDEEVDYKRWKKVFNDYKAKMGYDDRLFDK